MNIEFCFNNSSEEGKLIVFNSTNFPENINFKIGDYIWIRDFEKFLKKGFLYSPDSTADYGEFNDISGLCEVVLLHHGYDEVIGYILIVSVECR
jgi:hypothetical protein